MDQVTAKNHAALTQKSLELDFDLSTTVYRPLETIGSGAYGVVCSALCTRTNKKVAIKKITAIFESSSNEVAKRTAREIKILRHFRHENIVGILDIVQSNNTDVYIVLDLMETDLHHIIYSKQPLSVEHVKFFLYQLLRGLKFIHSANVIHRDLKPSNLLVNEDCHLKIGDFGMARPLSSAPQLSDPKLTHYVATRWYRAPEVMLMMDSYNTAVDMWSVGCILAEMLKRKHLFPGRNFLEQLGIIMEVLGRPPENLIRAWRLSDLMKNSLQVAPVSTSRPLHDLLSSAPRPALTLLEQLLNFDPRCRPSAEEALTADFLGQYRRPDDEPICGQKLDFNFEQQLSTRNGLREAILKEVDFYKQKNIPIKFEFKPVLSTQSENVKTLNFTPSYSDDKTLVVDGLNFLPAQAPSVAPVQSRVQAPAIAHVQVPVTPVEVEMLSAKLQESLAVNLGTNAPTADIKPDIKTEMTAKERLKQVLLSSAHRKQKDTGKPRHMTALQKQREREEKRKRKKERRKKRQGSSDNIPPALSSADRTLLEKWKLMHPSNTAAKVHPSNTAANAAAMAPSPASSNHSDSADPILLENYSDTVLGEGYGCGVNLDLLLGEVVNTLQSNVPAPPSATESLMNDCLEVSGLENSDYDEIQKELGLAVSDDVLELERSLHNHT